MKEEEIKTMKLYHHLERIERRLQELGYSDPSVVVDPEQLGTLDSLHFFGNEPVEKVVSLLQDEASSLQTGNRLKTKVMDIGTGFGNTARLVAHRAECRVDALELQPDMSDAAKELTRRCGLERKVTHLTGDFLQTPLIRDEYDVVVALLCFLHIGDWKSLFKRCFAMLKPGGVMYIEDFFQKHRFSSTEKQQLKEDVYCAELLPLAKLQKLLAKSGFEEVEVADVTDKWVSYVTERSDTFEAELEEHVRQDGEDAAKSLRHFYKSVASLFQGGNLGGLTLTVRKPLETK